MIVGTSDFVATEIKTCLHRHISEIKNHFYKSSLRDTFKINIDQVAENSLLFFVCMC